MSEKGPEALAEVFQAERRRLIGQAQRTLGSRTDAEDAVQEAWIRLARQDPHTVDNLSGWLTTVVGRVCLDMLRALKIRPETTYDDVPDFVVTEDLVAGPEEETLLADSVGAASTVVLSTLRPPERLAFVLHDTFAVPFDEIGQILNTSPRSARNPTQWLRGHSRGSLAVDSPSNWVLSHSASTRAKPDRTWSLQNRCLGTSAPVPAVNPHLQTRQKGPGTIKFQDPSVIHLPTHLSTMTRLRTKVELRGIEPLTFSLRTKRSTN